MNTEDLIPVLNPEVLKQKAIEAAMKGAVQSIEEFYSGYNSPFKKAVTKKLEMQELDFSFSIPDILAQINKGISAEIDKIANTAVAKSYIPMVQKLLVREEKEIDFSDFLKEFIQTVDAKSEDDVEIEMSKNHTNGWYSLTLSGSGHTYEATLHEDWDTRNAPDKDKRYRFLNLPHAHGNEKHYSRTMKIKLDQGAELELPFEANILNDKLCSYVARLIIAGSKIKLDTTSFSDDMFPESHCHC